MLPADSAQEQATHGGLEAYLQPNKQSEREEGKRSAKAQVAHHSGYPVYHNLGGELPPTVLIGALPTYSGSLTQARGLGPSTVLYSVQVLLATKLKRTPSLMSPVLFHFEEHFHFEKLIGKSDMSEVGQTSFR